MRTRLFGLIAVAAALTLGAGAAEAKGALTGAAKGAVVGHLAGHHAGAGAAIGAMKGHHDKVKAKKGK